MEKETFILVHSAWLGAWQWAEVVHGLQQKGHNVMTPDLPGHGENNMHMGSISMDDYVNTLTGIIDQIEGKIILVGHSFNGITISRTAELRPHKIKSLVYLAGFFLPDGVSFVDAVDGVENSIAVDNFYISDDQKYALVQEANMHKAFAHDIPIELFNEAKPFIVPEPLKPLLYKLEITEGNFGMLPKYYIECTEDKAIPIKVQRDMYRNKVRTAYSLASSHTPNFSQPDRLVEILNNIASEAP